MSHEVRDVGPVDYLVVEFPGNLMTGEGLAALLDLVDGGVIEILDLVFVRKDLDGSVLVCEVADLDGDGTLDLAVFEGASSGLLDEGDVGEATAILAPGNSAAIVVYENTWAAPFVGALRRSGAELIASGRIPLENLLASLDSTHPEPDVVGSTSSKEA
jgi:hypothetical protein